MTKKKSAAGLVSVTHCTKYTYLGSIFTSDGKVQTSVEKHADSRANTLNKLVRFLDRNENAPFPVKKRVVDACFSSSLLYGCESWLGVKPCNRINSLYMKAIKLLLGVRQQTTKVCLFESGYPSLEALVLSRQQSYIQKKVIERERMTDDPLMFALDMTHRENPAMSRYIKALLNETGDILENDKQHRIEKMKASKQTKMMTYRSLNPTFELHPIYAKKVDCVTDYLRINFTRFRTSSHRLRIETGRWSRIPPELRLCKCDEEVQNEEHVLTRCPLVHSIRVKYHLGVVNFTEFIGTEKSKSELCALHEMLKKLEI